MRRLMMSVAVIGIMLAAGNMKAQVPEQEEVEQEAQKQDVFEPIEVSDVPDKVSDAVDEKYEDAKISSAAVNDDDIYKLMVQTEGEMSLETVYFDEDGEEKEMKEEQQEVEEEQETNPTPPIK